MWTYGKSGGATLRKRQRKNEFLAFWVFFWNLILDMWQKWGVRQTVDGAGRVRRVAQDEHASRRRDR